MTSLQAGWHWCLSSWCAGEHELGHPQQQQMPLGQQVQGRAAQNASTGCACSSDVRCGCGVSSNAQPGGENTV